MARERFKPKLTIKSQYTLSRVITNQLCTKYVGFSMLLYIMEQHVLVSSSRRLFSLSLTHTLISGSHPVLVILICCCTPFPLSQFRSVSRALSFEFQIVQTKTLTCLL